jgi:lipopolysaccharide export system protein LptA
VNLHWIHTATILSIFLSTSFTQAQTVEILAADQILRDPAVTEAQRLIGHVKLGHQDAVLTCDSAWRFDDGSVEVFSHVVMQQPPATTMAANYLRIEPNENWAMARGDVELQHETARLSAPSLMYLLNSRTVRYTEGANIVDEGWTVNSRHGQYRTASEILELGGNVLAVNEGDTMRSDSLHWMRTESRYRFLRATEWVGSDVRFSCMSGDIVMYEEPLGWLAGKVKVDDGEGTVQGDSLAWGASSSEVWGSVVLTQSDGTGTVHGQYALRQDEDTLEVVLGNEQQRAWLEQIDEGDTLLLAADTLQRRGEFLTAFHRVTLVQDELVGVGDSLVWMDTQGTIQMWGEPRLWSSEDKLSGDTLTLWLTDQSPDKLEMRGHAVVLSSANDTLAHRIQGRDLDAFFEEGELSFVDVVGNGEVITFEVPEEGQEGSVRMNTAVCAKVTLEVAEQKLKGIALKQGPRGRIEPIQQGQDLEAFQVDEAPRLRPWETSEQGPLPE